MTSVHSSQTVLVADDDPAIHAIFRRLLKPLGVRLVSCLDGISARDRAWQEIPDLVFLDVLMPGLDGTEVCKSLRAGSTTAMIPILMLSGRGQPEDRLKGLQSGANDYIVKPIAIPEVVAKVRTYLELSRLHRKAVEAERRRAVTGLLRGLAHQFNNILCGISGTAQVLDLRVGADSPLKEQARTIVQYSQRAATISQQLLVLAGARRDCAYTSDSVLLETIRQAWDASLAGTNRSHRLDIHGSFPAQTRLQIGTADLQASLFHVLQNAVRAMPEGGDVLLLMAREGDVAEFTITDHGCGMSPADLDRALEPFYQNWDRPSDAGLGLPFVRALLEEVGGALELQSREDRGTVVRLRVPAN